MMYSSSGGGGQSRGGGKIDPSLLIEAANSSKTLLGAEGWEGGSSSQNAEMDSTVQMQKRKLQRRQANRKSAQLSRARKKAHLEELKEENMRLQHMADILDSQAEFIFSFNVRGEVIFIPDRMQALIKSAADDPEEDIVHINQILTQESVMTLIESLKEIKSETNSSSSQSVTFVKEVYYQDATGFPVAGFMRCSRLQRRKRCRSRGEDEANVGGITDSDSEEAHSPTLKRKGVRAGNKLQNLCKKSNIDHIDLLAASEAAYGGGVGGGEDEYVCVIRPASTSTPHCLNNLHLLSAASMVAHDSVTTGRSPHDGEVLLFERRGSPSDDSNSSGLPHSSLTTDQTKNSSTSSADDRNSDDRSDDTSTPSANEQF